MEHPVLRSQKSTNVRLSPALAAVRAAVGWIGRFAPSVAGWIAARLFTTPRRYARPAQERAALQTATVSFAIEHEGRALRAWEWGEGPVVLLVHGWEGRGSQLGAFVPRLVRAGYKVVAFDGPAHGESAGSQTNLVEYARVVERVVDAVGPVAGVIAHSFGAAATTIALGRGAPIERVAYLAPLVGVDKALDRFARFLGLSPASHAAFRARVEHDTKTPVAKLEGLGFMHVLRTPVLAIHDPGDAEVPGTETRDLARAWPGARVLEPVGLGHRRIVRDDGIVEAVTRFLLEARPFQLGPQERLERELFDRDARRNAFIDLAT